MSTNTYHLLFYRSEATRLMSPAQLVSLMADVRQRNQNEGLTGVLLHHGVNFLQVLEGDEAAVSRTFARIARDARHGKIDVLLDQSCPERLFGPWAMACPLMDCPKAFSASTANGWIQRPEMLDAMSPTQRLAFIRQLPTLLRAAQTPGG